MKKGTTNQFDYPNNDVHVFKKYQPQKTVSLTQTESQKQRYKHFLKEQHDIQRKKVKEQQSRKKQQQRLQNKLKIKNQLEHKKKQLEQLQRIKKQEQQQQKRSYELAIIKQEQDNINKMQQQHKNKQYAESANVRFIEALRRMEQQNQKRDIKKTQALHRRKVVEQTQKVQRNKVIQYKNYLQEQQKLIEPQIKRGFDQYKQSLGRVAYNKNVDYTKTRIHNPAIIIQNQNQSPNAIEQAQIIEQVRRDSTTKKKQQTDQMRRKSQQRGKQALLQLQRDKQYEQYCKQAQEKAKKYNIQRIQAGKINQYVGIKPGTLEQMEMNKKIRSEEQFEKMFLFRKDIENVTKKATKHEIINARDIAYLPPQSLLNNYIKGPKEESQIPGISAGKYSFESEGIQDLTSVKKVNRRDVSQDPSKGNIQQVDNSQQEDSNLKRLPKRMNPNNQKDKKIQPQTYYLEPQSRPKQQQSQNDIQRSNKRQIVYNNQQGSLHSKFKNQGQLSNIGKNKKRGQQDLNYSESQESFV